MEMTCHPVNSSLHRTSHLVNSMFVFLNNSSNISSPEIVSICNIDDVHMDGMLLTPTQITLDFVSFIPGSCRKDGFYFEKNRAKFPIYWKLLWYPERSGSACFMHTFSNDSSHAYQTKASF